MLAIIRLQPATVGNDEVLSALDGCVEAMSQAPGFRSGSIGRAADDAGLWVLASDWVDIGSYRRAMSSYETKVAFGNVQHWIVNEPSAYETYERPGVHC